MTNRMRIVTIFLIFILLFVNASIYFAQDNDEAETVQATEKTSIIIPVLMYHNIAEEYAEATAGANITPKRFEEHMLGILDRGYTPIFVADYYNSVKYGTKLPENPIIVTFDDGYLSNYEVAYPILKRLNIPATIFVVTSTVGAKPGDTRVSYPHFTWEQAREMQQSGIIDIQSHSHTHCDMTSLSPARLQEELRLSRYLIEQNLNKNCYVFSYPFGRYNQTTSNIAKYAGYRMQILVNYAESGEDYLANNTKYGLEHFTRLTVSGSMTTEELFSMIDTAVENSKRMENSAW